MAEDGIKLKEATHVGMAETEKISRTTFLKDVFICSLGAFGGPEAHYGIFTDQMVTRRGYLTEEELVELIALTGILPGPGSTQTIVAIGHKVGGPRLAALTMVVWAFPAILLMTLLSFMSQILEKMNLSQAGLKYVGAMAVGFILVAGYRLGRKVTKDGLTGLLLLLGAVTTYFFHAPWVYPLVLLAGGAATVVQSKERPLWNKVSVSPPWPYFIAFAVLALTTLGIHLFSQNKFLGLFESFYRYGYLVIGGGQVVIPLMNSELVDLNGFMTNQEFLTGFGLVQGMPGPMFSFAAYAGGMAMREVGTVGQFLSGIILGLTIFLPGFLLIFFVYPIWEDLKKVRAVKLSLRGITAVAAGLICASGISLLQKNGFAWDQLLVTGLSCLALLSKKVPAPVLVILTIALGALTTLL